MDRKTKTRYETRAKIIKAMAHPTRLFIVDRLAEREHCVCELTQMIGDDISTVSRHLSLLKNAGVVSDEKRGTQVFYALCCPCIFGFFSCIESVIQANVEEQSACLK